MRPTLITLAAAITVGLALMIPAAIMPAPDAADQLPGSPVCVDRPDHADLGEGEVVSVRLCPAAIDGQTQAGAIPDGEVGVVGDDAARLVAQWRARPARRAGCNDDFGGQWIRVQVGFADGSVSEVTGRTGGCALTPTPPSRSDQSIAGGDFVYREILTRAAELLAQEFVAAPPGEPVVCPGRPGVLDQDADGASVRLLSDTGLVLALPAAEATVCSFLRGELIERTVAGGAAAESLRLSLHSGVTWGAVADCDVNPASLSYVVTLADKTGTRRGFAIDGPACHALLTSGVRPDGYSDFGLGYDLAAELGLS